MAPDGRYEPALPGRSFDAVVCEFGLMFSLHDAAAVRSLLDAAGFVDVQCATVEKVGQSPSAADAATGLIEGNPVFGTIMERRPEALPDLKAAVARNVAAALGDHSMRCALRAHVFSARHPRA